MTEPDHEGGSSRRRLSTASADALWAAAAGLTAFVVYVRTLAPGVTDDVDSAMFQFIGRALGVAHNPGYPLYVLLTHPISLIPVGSLAYRVNLFSALLGAVTVALSFLVSRRLGCRRIVSLAAALGVAFGRVFWSQAVIAEVYTLHAAIVAGTLLAILAWKQTKRRGLFFLAVALFAAGLGNHTTLVGFAPGLALYAVLADRAFVLRARTIAAVFGLLAAGLLQYGFVILRSLQPGAYVESRATTIGELARMMLGGQFQDRLFAFRVRAIVHDRLPEFLARILVPELTWPGLALAAAGALWLLRRRPAEALLLMSGAGAVLVFALNYSVIDTAVFLIPMLLVLWLLFGVGVEHVIPFVTRRTLGAAGSVALALPLWLVARNFAFADRSRDTEVAVALDRLFDALPARAAMVRQDFISDRMVTFKLLDDQAAQGRRVELAPEDPAALRRRLRAGVDVFAFGKAAERLRRQGLGFSFAPLPLVEGPLADLLARLDAGAIVAVAVPAAHMERFAATGVSLASIGGPDSLESHAAVNLGAVGVRGGGPIVLRSGAADLQASAAIDAPPQEAGVAAPTDIEVRVDGRYAAIRQASRDLVRTSEGVAVAVWSADGTLERTCVLQASDNYLVPLGQGRLSVYPLRGEWPGQALATGDWADIAAMMGTGSLMLQVPSSEALVVYVGDDAPLAPRVIDASGRARVDIRRVEASSNESESASPGADRDAPPGRDLGIHVFRIEIDASEGQSVSVLLALGGIPSHAVGRVAPGGPRGTAMAFRIDTDGLLRRPDRTSEVLSMTRDEQAQATGHGWSAVDADGAGSYRWMTETGARLVLPIEEDDVGRIRVQVLREEGEGPTLLSLRVNGAGMPAQPLKDGWHAYEWAVPDGVVASSPLEVELVVDRLAPPSSEGAEPHGVALGEVRVLHGQP